AAHPASERSGRAPRHAPAPGSVAAAPPAGLQALSGARARPRRANEPALLGPPPPSPSRPIRELTAARAAIGGATARTLTAASGLSETRDGLHFAGQPQPEVAPLLRRRDGTAQGATCSS